MRGSDEMRDDKREGGKRGLPHIQVVELLNKLDSPVIAAFHKGLFCHFEFQLIQ